MKKLYNEKNFILKHVNLYQRIQLCLITKRKMWQPLLIFV